MARRGFYEDYQKERKQEEQYSRPVVISGGFGTAVAEFFRKLFTAVLYLAATALSSIGLTTLLNKPLRDMLFELVTRMFFGQ